MRRATLATSTSTADPLSPAAADRSARRHRWVGRLGVAGGALGVIAGTLQATIGARIPEWSGAKASPIALGLLTIGLSLLAGGAALRQRDPRLAVGGRAACALAIAGPGLLGLSTAGRLWYPSALLLVLAGTMTIDSWPATGRMLAADWYRVLLGALGASQLLMAAGAAPALAVVGAVGGVALIVVAGWLSAPRPVVAGLLVVGLLPFAALAWAGIGPPLIALAAAVIAVPALRRTGPGGASR